jgi:hypothetical protein
LKSLQTPPHQDLLDELDWLLLMLERLAKQDDGLLTPLFHLFSIRLYLFPEQAWPIATPRQLERMQLQDYRQRAY